MYRNLKAPFLFLISMVLLCNTVWAKPINVVSREDGSGTRGAFVELSGVLDTKNKEDMTTLDAIVVNSTSVVMGTVANDPYAIGYISLGLLNDKVKALSIDDVTPTTENVKNGSYKIARPFNLVLSGELNDASSDFINYVLSSDGQKVVEKHGYVSAQKDLKEYKSNNSSGKIVVSGSTSVTPIMEKLKEGYMSKNPNVKVEIQMSDSSTGVNSAISGICDIGMASRELKESEVKKGAKAIVMAMDGIAIIVNKKNQLSNISKNELRSVYVGETTNWKQLSK